MATVFDARYRRRHRLLTDASAGHPPPLVVRGRDAFFAELQPGLRLVSVSVHRKPTRCRSNRETTTLD
jgi:hypothetical protein